MNHSIPHKEKRGSVLITTLILAAIMAMVIGSFIQLASHENRLANIAFQSNSSLNLAEAGLEKALYALNYDEWNSWSKSGTVATMRPYQVDLGSGMVGVIRVRVEDFEERRPVVISEGRVLPAGRPDVVKQVEVRLSQRGYWDHALTAREGVTFSGGNASVDSYISSLGPWNSVTNRRDNGSVASASVEVDSVSISNAFIYGRVATGGHAPRVGPNGIIRGADSPLGLNVDPERVTLDFAAEFPPVTAPTTFHYVIGNLNSNTTLGTPGASAPTIYRVNNINLNNRTLTIQGPVVFVVDGDVEVGGGSGEIVINNPSGDPADNASLVMFVKGNMDVKGNGAVNMTNVPANLIIYGTSTVGQSFDLRGNADLQAAIYAPEASVSLRGGGSTGTMSGAVVAKSIFINGTYSFHYDEDLANLVDDDATYRMDRWRELYAVADRFVFSN